MNKKEEIEIKFLSPRDAVRKRAGMYVGGVENANVLIREILDNCGDELSAGYGSDILVSNNFNDGWIFVADNGRGIPITYSKDKPTETQAKLAISELHSGSKFESSDYARTGLNGVGSSAVNFLSETYILMSKITGENYNKSIPQVRKLWEESGPRSRKDLFYILVYEKGYLKYEGAGKLKDLEKNIFSCPTYISIPSGMSTIVLFKPDPEIFTSTKAEIPIKNLQYFLLIQEKLYGRKLNVEVDGVSIKNDFKPYRFEVINTIIPKDTSANKQVSMYLTFEADPDLKGSEEGSVNGLVCESGMHLNLARNLYKAALKDFFKINHDYLLNGFKFKVVLIANEVTFSSQTKENLKSITKVNQKDFVEVVKSIEKIFKKHQDYWEEHVGKLNYLADSMRKIGAAEKAQRMIDEAQGRGMFKSKVDYIKGFSDATGRDRWNCELFLVEGDSAGGALKAGRKDTLHHSVLPLRGKILSVVDKSVEQALDNKEIHTIFKVIGLGMDVNNVTSEASSPDEAYELIKKYSRFGKIIIAVDADSDGSQICKLILYMFGKFGRFLLDYGMIYQVVSPIFEQGNKKFYPDDPIQPGTTFPVGLDPTKPFSRYKGLGGWNREDIYDVFYNPLTRRLIRITPEGFDYSMELNESIEARKKLLYNEKIITNPYGFKD